MVLVILGTQDKKFTRLIDMVIECIDDGIIKDKVIVQNGNTKYESDKVELIGFVSSDKMNKLISDSKYIITHGGVGSIINSLDNNKKVIAVARLKKYKEHENDHQLQIINEFTKMGYILDGTYDLKSSIKKLKKFKPKKYVSNHDNFVKLIEDYIDNN